MNLTYIYITYIFNVSHWKPFVFYFSLTAIDVIGNLAAVDGGDEEHLDEDGDENTAASVESKKKSAHMAQIHQLIMVQGGVRGIIEAMKGPCSSDSSGTLFANDFFDFF